MPQEEAREGKADGFGKKKEKDQKYHFTRTILGRRSEHEREREIASEIPLCVRFSGVLTLVLIVNVPSTSLACYKKIGIEIAFFCLLESAQTKQTKKKQVFVDFLSHKQVSVIRQ